MPVEIKRSYWLLASIIYQRVEDIHALMDEHEFDTAIDEILSLMSEREARLCKAYFGIHSEIKTYKQIGSEQNPPISGTRVAQIISTGTRKVRRLGNNKFTDLIEKRKWARNTPEVIQMKKDIAQLEKSISWMSERLSRVELQCRSKLA